MLKKVISDESGRILVWTLVILGIGALLIPTLLTHASTNLLATRVTEEGLKELYAANAGVEYALYLLANDDCPIEEPFGIPTAVNGKPITVTVENVGIYYKITSTAGGTVIGSDSEYAPGGNLDIFKGALVSGGEITLHTDCTVTGTIYYEEGDLPEVEQTEGDLIKGGWSWPTQEENEAFAGVYRDEAMEGDTWEGEDEYTIPPPTNLGPVCIDGDLKVTQDTTLTLEGTIYVTGSITMKNTITITGTGSIIATGDITFEKELDYSTEGSSIIMSLNGDIYFKMKVYVEALIYAPNGRVYFNKEADVIGGVVARDDVESNDIYVKKGSSFTYDAGHWNTLELPGYEEARFKMITYDIDLNSE